MLVEMVADGAAGRVVLVSRSGGLTGPQVLDAARRAAGRFLATGTENVVLLDLKLGDISGQDILKEVKKDEFTADIPVIVYTAAVIEAEEVRRLIEGDTQLFYNVDIVKKPFELEPLLDKIDMMIEGRRRGSTR